LVQMKWGFLPTSYLITRHYPRNLLLTRQQWHQRCHLQCRIQILYLLLHLLYLIFTSYLMILQYSFISTSNPYIPIKSVLSPNVIFFRFKYTFDGGWRCRHNDSRVRQDYYNTFNEFSQTHIIHSNGVYVFLNSFQRFYYLMDIDNNFFTPLLYQCLPYALFNLFF